MLRFVLFVSMTVAALAQTPTVVGVSNEIYDTHLSPGTLAFIFGTNFGTGAASSVMVTIGGKTAYVFVKDVTPNQLLVQIPVDAPVGNTTVTVTANATTSAPFTITLDSYAPAFAEAGNGGVYITTPTGSIITAASPAHPGDKLVAYAIGLGQTNPPTPTGPAAATNPTAITPTLTVGGVAATVQFAGMPATFAGTYQINFTVPTGVQGTAPLVLSIGGKNSPAASLPLFGISAVVSNASFGSAGTAAPASIATLFANGLGSMDQTTGFPGTTFQGVSVIVNGRSAPLFHLSASANQIDFLMPTELPASGTVNVQLVTPSGMSPDYTLTLAPAVPAFYRIPDPATKGRSNIIAQFANTAWLALPASTATALKLAGNCKLSMANPLASCAEPAASGDYLVIYTTGLGKTTPNGDPNGIPLATGAIPPANGSVLYKTVATPVVTVGGVPAMILYSGLAPGFPGEYQVDIQVPPGVTPGDDIPVTITMPGSTTDTVTISVQPRG